MGLTLDYFYSLTPRQFFNTLAGWQRRNEADSRDAWLRARLVGFSAVSPYLGKTGAKSPEKWLPFPWEKANAKHNGSAALPSAEEHAAALDKWAKYDAKKAANK